MHRRAHVGIGVALAAQITGAQAQQASGSPPEPPPISLMRYTEDYSYLRDPDQRSGAWWEPFKFIPLSPSGRVYVTLGNELRLRYEHYINNGFGAGPKPTEGYLWFRTLPYASVQFGPRVRVVGQLQGAWAIRSSLTKNPSRDQTGLDLVQAFADVRFSVGRPSSLTLRAGRQVMVYGRGRLINAGSNVRLSFDGGLAEWTHRDWRVDAFFVRPVAMGFDWFDDRSDSTRKVWSVYATRSLPQIGPDAGIDFYYFGYVNEAAVFNQGSGRELRHSLGTHVFGTAGPWGWDVETLLQFGTFAGAGIRAWTAALEGTYTFEKVAWKPWVGLRDAIISGDHSRTDARLGTFNPMFPLGGYFGEHSVYGPFNLVNFHPVVGASFGSGWTLTVGFMLLWRYSLGDGLYDLSGNLLRGDGGSRSRHIATQNDVSVGWAVNRNLSFDLGYSLVRPGQYIADTGPAETVHFFGTHVTYTF